MFKQLDKSKCGRLTLEQLAEGLQRLGIKQDPQALMSILDLDQNGYVSYTEFLAGVLSTREDLPERLLLEAFETFDLDGDGTISMNELRAMLSGDGPRVDVLPDGQTVEDIMEEVSDGEGMITFEKFRAYLQKEPESAEVLSRAVSGTLPGNNLDRAPGRPHPMRSEPKMLPSLDKVSHGSVGTGELPPLHRLLIEEIGNPQQVEADAINQMLFSPDVAKEEAFKSQHLLGICRHFLAGACYARLLAQGKPTDQQHLREAVAVAEQALEASLQSVAELPGSVKSGGCSTCSVD